ncbi:hypothetical protein ACV8V6_26225 [Citrobacter portucalensis]
MRFVIRDPKKGSSGSDSAPPARSGPETQHMPLYQRNYLLYVVLIPLYLTRFSGAEKTASLIP